MGVEVGLRRLLHLGVQGFLLVAGGQCFVLFGVLGQLLTLVGDALVVLGNELRLLQVRELRQLGDADFGEVGADQIQVLHGGHVTRADGIQLHGGLFESHDGEAAHGECGDSGEGESNCKLSGDREVAKELHLLLSGSVADVWCGWRGQVLL
ncbi:hypothetical protein D3C71_1577470 [compost metagenome]